VANNWFLKQSQIAAGLPNVPAKELRNTFGGSFGAPIQKDKLFYFVAFEGQRTAESQQVFQEVPSAAFRNGMLTYVTGSGTETLTPADIASMDPNCSGNGTCPLGAGDNPAALAYYNQLPQSNTYGPTDGYNLFGYTFASPAPQSTNTLLAKLDYNIHDRHRLFLRANDQLDHSDGTEQFPGQPPSYTLVDDSKGIAAGDIWTITNSLVNNLRYGLVHQSFECRRHQSELCNLSEHFNLESLRLHIPDHLGSHSQSGGRCDLDQRRAFNPGGWKLSPGVQQPAVQRHPLLERGSHLPIAGGGRNRQHLRAGAGAGKPRSGRVWLSGGIQQFRYRL
jgi:hypothetical protein